MTYTSAPLRVAVKHPSNNSLKENHCAVQQGNRNRVRVRNNSKRNLISKRPTAFVRVRSVIFSLIKSEKIIRSLSCKNPFCAIVKGLRFPKASEEQIPTAICEETTKRVNCHKNGNLSLFCIEKDTRDGVLYAPFACVLMVELRGVEPLTF